MENIHLAENIGRFRREKKITQEQLAEFLGVTKASVSKWETRQSMPDVLLLPRLATYFDVTIDNLLGYEPMLGREQIQKIYKELAEAFATEEFEAVMARSKTLVKKYYSCYDFLTQMITLWMNHYMLPGGNRSIEILEEAHRLCEHILESCKDIRLCNNVVALKAGVDLLLGNSAAVIETLEDVLDPGQMMMQSEGVLVNAYLQAGEMEKANDFTQITMYMHLLALVSEASLYLTIHKENLELCEETGKRITEVANAYHLEELNFNVIAIFYYQMAMIYCLHKKKKEAIEQLEQYAKMTAGFLCHEKSHLKSDDYFDRLDFWLEKLAMGGNIPRDKKIIYESLMLSFETPAFEILKEETEFQRLRQFVERKGECYERDDKKSM